MFIANLIAAVVIAGGVGARNLQAVAPIVATADIQNLQLSGFLGRWYQLYASPLLVHMLDYKGGIYCPVTDVSESSRAAEVNAGEDKDEQKKVFDWSTYFR